MKKLLVKFFIGFVFWTSNLFAVESYSKNLIRLSNVVDYSQLEEAYVSNQFYYHLAENELEKINKALKSIQAEYSVLVEEINQIVKQETKEQRAALSQKHKEKLPLLPLPTEPGLILSLETTNEKIQEELIVLKKEINELKIDENKTKNSLENLSEKLNEILNIKNEIQSEIEKIEGFLDLHLNGSKITNDELISYLEDYMPNQGTISILAEVYKSDIFRVLANKDKVIEGGRSGFENVPQGTSFILWDMEENRSYDFESFSAKEFKLPVFKPINVDLGLEENVELLGEYYTYSNLPNDRSWSSKTENNFTKCLDHKSFSKARAVADICMNLFPKEAYLNIDLANDYLRYGSPAFILSASAAEQISNLLISFFDEAKVLLEDEFPKSFIEPTKGFLQERLAERQTKLIDAEDKATKLSQSLADKDSGLGEIIDRLNENEQKMLDLEDEFSKNVSIIQVEKREFDRIYKETDLTNENLRKIKSKEMEDIFAKIKEAKIEIESRFLKETNSFENSIKELETQASHVSSLLTMIQSEQVKLEVRLSDYYKEEYIKKNLSSELTFEDLPFRKTAKKACFKFKLTGDFFITPPTSVNFKYKGSDVPEVVKWHLLGVSNSINNYMPTFINKYQELVVGVAPSKKKNYTNSALCHETRKQVSGEVARFFEAKGYDFLVPKNWSMEAIGIQLGAEDDLLKETANFIGVKQSQKATSNAVLFAEDINELRTLSFSKFQLSSQLENDLLDFQNKDSAALVQQILKLTGYYSGSIDGTWGPVSNQAMKNFMGEKGYVYENEDNWSMELQVELLTF